MKTKIYSLSILALLFFALSSHAQCSVTMTSLTTNGLTATGQSVGTGAAIPVYVWSWGDTQTSTTQNANHTYASAGTYTVCIAYGDVSNANCIDTACAIINVTVSGIATNTPIKADVEMMPNPFVTSTNISLTLNQQTDVVISVYDVTGNLVTTLQNGTMNQGFYLLTWKPETLANGIYFVQIKAGDSVQTRKVVKTSAN